MEGVTPVSLQAKDGSMLNLYSYACNTVLQMKTFIKVQTKRE